MSQPEMLEETDKDLPARLQPLLSCPKLRGQTLSLLLAHCTAHQLQQTQRETTRLLGLACNGGKISSRLPDEVLLLVFANADTKSVFALSCVSRRFHRLLTYDNIFWKQVWKLFIDGVAAVPA